MYSPSKQHRCHPFYLCSIHFSLSPAPAWCWWCWLGPDLAPGHGHQRNWVLAAGWSPASTSPAMPRHISAASTSDFVTAEFLGTARRLLFHEMSTTTEITKMLNMRHNAKLILILYERLEAELMWWWNNFISLKKSTFSCEKLNHTGRSRVLIV